MMEVISADAAPSSFILHPAQAQQPCRPSTIFGLHVGQLLLDQLVGRQRLAELLAV
jgi:hypothetical protein